MTPLSFDIDSAKEIVGDARVRMLSGEARKFADAGNAPRRLWKAHSAYWDGVVAEMARVVWMDAYRRRKARIKRIQQ